ncbi:MAG: nucleotide exchange factor GrpE, partial [Defluviitaleaceae bacterium]|nr:nucleotide exchange factor GrpE [Defluviitaleaceae bacterium]
WQQCLDEARDFFDRRTSDVFGAVKRGLLKKFLAEARAAANIGGRDEKIYVCCGRVTDSYRRAVGIYEANKSWLKTVTVVEILSGLTAVLTSRVRQFDENQDRENTYENPILSEKKTILGTDAAYFIHEAQLAEEAFRNGAPLHALPAMEDITEYILQNASERLRAAYEISLAQTVGRLRDFHGPDRVRTAFYLGLLESERDVLSSVIRIQAAALEGELSGDAANSHEKTIVLGILAVIREGYQYFGGEAAEILEYVKSAPQKPDLSQNLSADEWLGVLRSCLDAGVEQESARPASYAKFTGILKEALPMVAARAAGRLDFSRAIHRARELRGENVSLAEVIKPVFDALCAQDIDILECAEPEGGIIRGVLETMAIKSESVEENTRTFSDECEGIIGQNVPDGGCSLKISDEELKTMFGGARSAWESAFPEIPCSDREISQKLREFSDKSLESEGFASYSLRLQKAGERILAQTEKAAARFRKDSLLYEVSTFEEIINYSISRLRQSDNPAVSGFAAAFDGAAAEIYKILSRSGIEVIEPQPHDAFNGREHEVLLAETSPDFVRGEIIKRVSLGYKQNGTVLLRANVIAAR